MPLKASIYCINVVITCLLTTVLIINISTIKVVKIVVVTLVLSKHNSCIQFKLLNKQNQEKSIDFEISNMMALQSTSYVQLCRYYMQYLTHN